MYFSGGCKPEKNCLRGSCDELTEGEACINFCVPKASPLATLSGDPLLCALDECDLSVYDDFPEAVQCVDWVEAPTPSQVSA